MDGNYSTTISSQEPLISHTPPAGFSSEQDGIYVEKTNKDGETDITWLCSPLAVVAIGRDDQHRNWSRCIEMVDPDQVVHRWIVLEKDLTNGFNKVLADLRGRGLRLASGTTARGQLQDLITRWEPEQRYTSTDRLGWVNDACDAFVLGDGRVIGNENIAFLNNLAPDVARKRGSHGTLEEWRALIAARCIGNPILIASVSLALAGPLVQLLEKESAGMHLRGVTSKGKTTAVRVATSVWGSPDLKHLWRSTVNALEGTAATCNGSLLVLDEIGMVSGREVGDAVYALMNGQEKARSSANGQLRSIGNWRLTLLSNGEISLAEKMAEANKRTMAGQEVRLIDIAADMRRHGVFDDFHDAADGETFSEQLKLATANCYGVAGPAFVEKLIGNVKKRGDVNQTVARLLAHWKNTLECHDDSPSVRVLGHFALVAVAGELATKFGITGWQPKTAIRAVFELAKDWLEARDLPEHEQIQAALCRTRDFLKENGRTLFTEAKGPQLVKPAGYRDDKWFYILGDTWNTIHTGHSPSESAKYLLAGNRLIRGDGNNQKSKTPGWVPGRPRAYKVRASILDEPA